MLLLAGLLGLALLGFLGFATFVLSTENSQHKANASYPSPEETRSSKTLVAYFSRSKNTEVAAKAIAQKSNARLLQIEATDYALGFKGWGNANQDARKQHAEIQHTAVDFNQIDTLYIGSPIWWYSPAPPIWQFIANHELQGTKVILFNTFNSKFGQKYIDSFAKQVKEKGGEFMGHISVKRERMGSQITQEELVKRVYKQQDGLVQDDTGGQ